MALRPREGGVDASPGPCHEERVAAPGQNAARVSSSSRPQDSDDDNGPQDACDLRHTSDIEACATEAEGGAAESAGEKRRSSGSSYSEASAAYGDAALSKPDPVFVAECRICLSTDDAHDFISPCKCTGTQGFVHFECLKIWTTEKRSLTCELCAAPYEPRVAEALQKVIDSTPPPVRSRPARAAVNVPIAASGHLLASSAAHAEPQLPKFTPSCLWIYGISLFLLLFAVLYTTVWHRTLTASGWTMAFWRAMIIVLPVYIVLRGIWDLYRFRIINMPWGQYGSRRLRTRAPLHHHIHLHHHPAEAAAAAAGGTAPFSAAPHGSGGGDHHPDDADVYHRLRFARMMSERSRRAASRSHNARSAALAAFGGMPHGPSSLPASPVGSSALHAGGSASPGRRSRSGAPAPRSPAGLAPAFSAPAAGISAAHHHSTYTVTVAAPAAGPLASPVPSPSASSPQQQQQQQQRAPRAASARLASPTRTPRWWGGPRGAARSARHGGPSSPTSAPAPAAMPPAAAGSSAAGASVAMAALQRAPLSPTPATRSVSASPGGVVDTNHHASAPAPGPSGRGSSSGASPPAPSAASLPHGLAVAGGSGARRTLDPLDRAARPGLSASLSHARSGGVSSGTRSLGSRA